MKKCSKCKLFKKLSQFGKLKSKKDGLRNCCKLCRIEDSKEYYKNNKEKILNQSKVQHKKYPWKRIFLCINQRCNNFNCQDYKDYGDRGIKNLFKNSDEIKFLWFRDKAYLMKQPSIDRKDKDGNYTFDNCQFIEMSINQIKDRYKPILQFDLQGNFIKEWKSIKETGLYFKTVRSHISDVASGKRKTAGGFIWKYKN